MRDSELIRQRAEKLFEEIKPFVPHEEYHDTILTKIELAMLRAHIDTNTNVHDEDDEDE